MDSAVIRLGSYERDVRLAAARELGASIAVGELARDATREVNNHVHTIYSFSPYSPAEAAYRAWEAGLMTVGAMDHDSVAGCEEMLDAAEAIGIASTVGFELRVNMSGTDLEGRKFNNPDSENIAYVAYHGVPRRSLAAASEFLAPVQTARNERNRRMVERLDDEIRSWGIGSIDWKMIAAQSQAADGGSVTERHILFALARQMTETLGRGPEVVSFLTDNLDIVVPPRIGVYLADRDNTHYLYDLLGVMKSSLLARFYLQPGSEECIDVREAVAFAESIGAIIAYAYLGDVSESSTGDKSPDRFEDAYLDELFVELETLGFRAVTYMPPRNTLKQLKRVQALCGEHGFMEISGVDINSSRQSFACPEVLAPDFLHLLKAAWALVAHEKASDSMPSFGLFHPENRLASLPLALRIDKYARFGEAADPRSPDSVLVLATQTQSQGAPL